MVEIIVCAALLLMAVIVYLIATMILGKNVRTFESRMAEIEAYVSATDKKIEVLEERVDDEANALDREMDIVGDILSLQRDLIDSKNAHDTLLTKHDLYIQDIREKMEGENDHSTRM